MDFDGFAFLTRQENWNEFQQKVLKHAGSKLAHANDEIFATGAVWQNKLAQSFVNIFLSEQRIGSDKYEILCPISINSTAVVMDYKCKTLM